MKCKLTFFVNVLIIILLLFTTTSFANETENTEEINSNNESTNLNLYGKSCILIECSTNRVAYEKNAYEKIYPASTTKLLTAILAVENCNMDDVVVISNDMVSQIPPEYVTAYLRPGEQVTVEQLLNSLLIPSANDAGYALAIHISGSVDNFAELMNKKAAEIGCTSSHFTNPSGIHNAEHYSTARDMGLIGMYALRYDNIQEICKETSYVLHPLNSNPRTFKTTNTLIKTSEKNYYEFATGLKTGFTDQAGSCIIATAEKDNMKFLAVVMGAPESDANLNYRDVDCATLFEYGFANYAEITKVDEQVTNFIDKFTITSISLSTVLKIGITIIGISLFSILIKHGKKKEKVKL